MCDSPCKHCNREEQPRPSTQSDPFGPTHKSSFSSRIRDLNFLSCRRTITIKMSGTRNPTPDKLRRRGVSVPTRRLREPPIDAIAVIHKSRSNSVSSLICSFSDSIYSTSGSSSPWATRVRNARSSSSGNPGTSEVANRSATFWSAGESSANWA